MEWFWLFGHVLGENMLQNEWMFLNKNSDIIASTIHSFVYSTSVMLFVVCGGLPYSINTHIYILILHLFMNLVNIATRWLRLIQGLVWNDNIKKQDLNKPCINVRAMRYAIGSYYTLNVDFYLKFFIVFCVIKINYY